MNRFERGFRPAREASVTFQQGDFTVIVPGDHVRCAVTGEAIALEELRYWNVDRQEAYANADVALRRYLEIEAEQA